MSKIPELLRDNRHEEVEKELKRITGLGFKELRI
jgi:hypothetical protein